MGTRGHTPLAGLMLGSVTDRMLGSVTDRLLHILRGPVLAGPSAQPARSR